MKNVKRTNKNKILYSDYQEQKFINSQHKSLSEVRLDTRKHAQSLVKQLGLSENKWFKLKLKLDGKHEAIYYITNIQIIDTQTNFIDNTWTEYSIIRLESDKLISNGVSIEQKTVHILHHNDIDYIKCVHEYEVNKLLFNTVLDIQKRIDKLQTDLLKLYETTKQSDRIRDFIRREELIKSKMYALQKSGKHETWDSYNIDTEGGYVEMGYYRKSYEMNRLENELSELYNNSYPY